MSTLSQKCEFVYLQAGQSGVFDFILSHYPKTPWAWCPPCDSRSPRDTDYACLVCASPTEPYWGQDGVSN
jgi:hypothetical protein